MRELQFNYVARGLEVEMYCFTPMREYRASEGITEQVANAMWCKLFSFTTVGTNMADNETGCIRYQGTLAYISRLGFEIWTKEYRGLMTESMR